MTTALTPFVRRDPFSPVFDEFFRDFFSRPAWLPSSLLDGGYSMIERARMDVIDSGSSYEITVDLPGVKKEDINVSIDGSRVLINAETKNEKVKKDGGEVIYAERSAARFARSFELPAEVTDAGAEAHYENGVLTLTLPKKAAVQAKRLTVQ
ncbi:Hsp20/alpha crystallin family protein [Betaproteobacteria bacterium PRO7]|jgi:HSP20 family protein|nr:Hsp20/alpha crystallin family protein [Betaproteobacteria bacterium PRO7]